MHKNAKVVGLDCAASVLGKIGHRVVVSLLQLSSKVVVVVVVNREGLRQRVKGPDKKGQRRVYDML